LFLFIKFELFRFNINGNTSARCDEISSQFEHINGTQFIHYQKAELKKLFSNNETFVIINTIMKDIKFICEKTEIHRKIVNLNCNYIDKKDDDNGNCNDDNNVNGNKKKIKKLVTIIIKITVMAKNLI